MIIYFKTFEELFMEANSDIIYRESHDLAT